MSYLNSNVGWDDVVILKKQQHGISAGSNKQHSIDKNTLKLDQETEVLQHDKVSLDVGKIIAKRRVELDMTQKDLAVKICEKPQIVNEYESGKAIPNQQIISKMERCLGVKLRGKDKGKPFISSTKPTPAKK